MRNKIFVILFSAIFLFMFIGAPATLILTEKGILEYNNVGNEILAEKTYPEDSPLYTLLTGIETAKMEIKDTYINNLPGFLKITNSFKPAKDGINQLLVDYLQERGNEMTVFVCRHVFEEITVSPTCQNDGHTDQRCRLCGEIKRLSTSPKTEHAFEISSVKEPTCTTNGYTLLTCSLCSETKLVDDIVAKGHVFEVLETIPSDCTLEREEVSVCTVCNERVSKKLPISHHTYVNGECSVCGNKETVSPDHVHSYTESLVPPTCTQEGYTLFICNECGSSKKTDISLALGHTFKTTVTPPTCTSEGFVEQVCEICRESKITDKTPMMPHSYTAVTVPATPEAQGYDLYTCTSCSHEYKDNFVEYAEQTIPEPITTPDPEGTTYSASLKTTDRMFRHYEITAKFPNGDTRSTFARIVKLDRDILYKNMLEVVDLVNAMVEKDESVNWYFAFATNIEATEIGEKILPQESTRYVYESFLNLIDESIQVSSIKLNSFTDYYDKFYLTDHHWNHEGSEEAYNSIVRMLKNNYPDIAPLAVLEKHEFEDVEFYGSLARANASYKMSDIFGAYYHEMPYHTVKRDTDISYGSKKPIGTNIEKYLDGEFSTAQGYNHYTEFYRVCKEVSCPDNTTGRNLLIIGDSYSLPLLEIVSCHFDQTYIRYEDRSNSNLPSDLYYDEFIKENNITDVIVIEEMSKCIMKGYGSYYPSGFINIYPDKNY